MAIRWIEAADLERPSAPDADSAALAASWILYKLSGEKYPGVHTSTDWYGANIETTQYSPFSQHGNHINIFEVSDYSSRSLRLRSRPVQRVDYINVDGTELAQDDFLIGNKAFIARTDGTPWNLSQGVTVTYVHGIEPPEPGIRAAQRLANELVLSVEDPSNCALPDRVTSVSRQGISYAVLDPQDFIEKNRTGIYEIDLFLHSSNPINARKRPKILSPDIPSGTRKV